MESNRLLIIMLNDIKDICNSPSNMSYEYDPTPTDGEKLRAIVTIVNSILKEMEDGKDKGDTV